MLGAALPWAQGFVLYFSLCAVAVLAGRGLLRLLRAQPGQAAEWLLAPVLAFILWSLALGVTGGFRLPCRLVAPWLGGVSLLLAIFGLRRPWCSARTTLPVLVCLLLPVIVMPGRFAVGLTQDAGTVEADGYFYVAVGQYAWEYSRGVTEDLSRVHAYGAVYSEHRYLSCMLLGFVSQLFDPGNTLAAAGLFQAWVLFTAACAAWSFWLVYEERTGVAGLATVLAIAGGWTARVVWGNFFDHELTLVFAPALATLPRLWGARDVRRWLVLGGATAAVMYAYPFPSVFVLAGAGALLLPLFWHERADTRAWLLGGGFAAIVAVGFLLPGAHCLISHVIQESRFAAGWAHMLPNQICDDLLRPRSLLPALWAHPHNLPGYTAAAALSGLFLVGLAAVPRQRRLGVALHLAVLGASLVYLLAVKHFPYAAFKVITFSWYFVAGTAVVGGYELLARVRGETAKRTLTALLLLLVPGVLLLAMRAHRLLWVSPRERVPLAEFQKVRAVPSLIGGQSLTVAVDDWLANELAVYYLGNTRFELSAHRGSLCYCRMGCGPELPPATRFVLTDDGAAAVERFHHYSRLVWAAGPYCLWQMDGTPAGAVLVNFDSRSLLSAEREGYAVSDQEGDAYAYVQAREAGTLEVSARLVLGPRPAQQKVPELVVSTETGWQQRLAVEPGLSRFRVPVHEGMNRLGFGPSPPLPPPLDAVPRLLVRIASMEVELNPGMPHASAR